MINKQLLWFVVIVFYPFVNILNNLFVMITLFIFFSREYVQYVIFIIEYVQIVVRYFSITHDVHVYPCRLHLHVLRVCEIYLPAHVHLYQTLAVPMLPK